MTADADKSQPDTESRSTYSHLMEIGGYRIIKLLGIGGMGEVFLAEQKSMKRPVALKILSPALLNKRSCIERFFREIRTLGKIEHPNVVRALEAGADGDICFFSMQYVNGKDLSVMIDERGWLNELESLQTAATLAKTLAYVWKKHKMIHRDIKPSNIMIDQGGRVKLLDLGIAKVLTTDSQADLTMTMPGAMVGSPHYMSPEQAKAEAVDCRTDMYSLGATLYNMLAGVPPFDAETSLGIVARHISETPPDVRKANENVSKATSRLIFKLMAKNPDDRFASWEDAAKEIERIIYCLDGNNAPEDAAPEIAINLQKKRSFRRVLRLVAALALMVAALSVLIRYSLKEARIKRRNSAFAKTIKVAEKYKPEQYPLAISKLEKVIRDAPPAYAAAARKVLDQINQNIAASNRKQEKERLEATLKKLRAHSFKLETEKKYAEAEKLWDYYRRTGEFRNNPAFLEEAENITKYLKAEQLKSPRTED